MQRLSRGLWPLIAGVLLASSGCSLSTEPVVLQDFQWLAIENANDVVEGIDAAALGSDVALLGQMKTPTLCFRLNASFDRNGSMLTVRVTAEQSTSSTCVQTPGGYQYTAAIRGLEKGDYTLQVIHSVPGAGAQNYTKPISIR
jgi:hypothetical protein